MTNTQRANRNLRNARRQGESDAYNRLAAILAASITNNYISVNTSTILNQSETPSEPRTKEPKRKKCKSTQNNTITSPTNQKFTYTTQQPPRQPHTQTNTPQQTRKGYTGTYPLCVNCNFHHPTHTACRLCTTCDRLGHFAINCRTNPTTINSVAPTPCIPNIKPTKSCYECGDPTHFRNTCPNLRITPALQPDPNHIFTLTTAQTQVRPCNQITAPTIPTLQRSNSRILE